MEKWRSAKWRCSSRAIIVIEANPKKLPQTNTTGARALADWLCGERGQAFIVEYGRQSPDGIPLFHPVNLPDEAQK